MLPDQRREAILAQVHAQGAASAEELSRDLGVSVETIRRDLRGLRDQGLPTGYTAAPPEPPTGPARAASPPGAP